MSRASRGGVVEKANSPFARTLQKLMEEEPVTTQAKLAEITGKSRQTVSQYVNGISEPSFDTLTKIADYFHVSIDYLLDHSNGVRTTNTNIKSICNYTGLSETSVCSILRETAEENTRLALEVILCSDADKLHSLLTTVYRALDGYFPDSTMIRITEYINRELSIEVEEILHRWYGTFLDPKEAMRYNSVEAGKILSDILDNSKEVAIRKYQDVYGQIAVVEENYGID